MMIPGYIKNFRQRPTLPPSFPGSTIGAKELNFRVRDGNGCFLFAIATENILHFQCNNNLGMGTSKCLKDCANYFVAKPHDRLVPVS